MTSRFSKNPEVSYVSSGSVFIISLFRSLPAQDLFNFHILHADFNHQIPTALPNVIFGAVINAPARSILEGLCNRDKTLQGIYAQFSGALVGSCHHAGKRHCQIILKHISTQNWGHSFNHPASPGTQVPGSRHGSLLHLPSRRTPGQVWRAVPGKQAKIRFSHLQVASMNSAGGFIHRRQGARLISPQLFIIIALANSL